jgi:hypothetical protein
LFNASNLNSAIFQQNALSKLELDALPEILNFFFFSGDWHLSEEVCQVCFISDEN